MKCPSCEKRLTGSRCGCGWADLGINPVVRRTCGWNTEGRPCALLSTSAGFCLWHRHWLRLIEHGAPGRNDHEEFAEWWEQFQPYGNYALNPGQWWSAIDVLWPALRGIGMSPILTHETEHELFLRRSEVHRYEHGLPAMTRAPWARLSGGPLPPWHAEDWQAKVLARMKKAAAV